MTFIALIEGNDRTITFQARDSEGDVIDITGATMVMEVYEPNDLFTGNPTPANSFNGVIVTAASGLFSITFADTDYDGLGDTNWQWEIILTESGGNIRRYRGELYIEPRRSDSV